jgi:two-component system, OmpR family, phosphate regulon sensor histidine kinase PhoR
LLDTLFTSSEATPQIRPVIIDAEEKPLLRQGEELTQNEELWVQIPGGVLFPHLRLAYIRQVDSSPILPTLLPQVLPIAIAGALGLLALIGSFQADRRQREFVARQQAFIARVTHEFKTPLAGIKLMAESLQMGFPQNPEQSEIFIEKILMETDRLELRINEVLQVAKRAELKKMELIDAEMLMLELYDVWHPRFSEIKGVLRLEREGNEFFGDLDLIKDALNNLLSNAIKYRNPNRNLRTIFRIEEKGNWMEFSVSDNGIGVPVTERKRIFERFVRIETDNRGFSGGHGLGLAFVAETAEAHKGTVRCTDGINGGAKFSFRIPKNGIKFKI